MALIKCNECGYEVFDKASACPNWGCPVSEFEKVEHGNSDAHITNGDLNIHDSFNESPHYSPSESKIFKDHKLLAQYPIGELEKRFPFLGWLLGPLHLTCKDESCREQYDVINILWNNHVRLLFFSISLVSGRHCTAIGLNSIKYGVGSARDL